MLIFDYDPKERNAVLNWDYGDKDQKWLKLIISNCLEITKESQRVGTNSVCVPWWNFLSIREVILSVISGFSLKSGVDFDITPSAFEMLEQATRRQTNFFQEGIPVLSKEDLNKGLKDRGFARSLTNEQSRNVSLLLAHQNGASFSVPGAGKTTEALAFFAMRAAEGDSLLVVAPKNAFAAWDEQIAECMPFLNLSFERLRKTDKIPIQLLEKPKLMIIGYQQLSRVHDRIAKFLSERDVHIFLDESHRIKNPNSLTTRALLQFSHLAKSKLILSGTPMPQSVEDLVPQFNFLYPELGATVDTVIDNIKRIYVRTNKAELKLPKVYRKVVALELDPEQSRLYRLLKSELAREAEQALSENTRFALRRFGRSVTTVLQFVSNPGLLASKPDFIFATELSNALAEGEGPKLRYVIKRTRELAEAGNKVLIWSSFVKNIEFLSEALNDLGAVYIHGGVDAGSDEDEDTREGKIKAFHDHPSVKVMIANPAAASEGISLHRVCHHAIYLDRSFNAAQYLQSEDRIHRLGLRDDQETFLEIVECKGTIDETVRIRLESKVSAMARVLEDASLSISPFEINEEAEDTEDTGLDITDLKAIVEALR